MYSFKSYEKADTIEQAIKLLQANPEARLIAGGTDVLINIHEGKKKYQHIIDIHDVEELKSLSVQKNGNIVLGSGLTFTQIMEAEIIQKHLPIFTLALSSLGGPQVRNMATIGGNICNGVTSADSAPVLFCLNGIMNITGKNGDRLMNISDFYLGPGKVALDQDEILTSIMITKQNYTGYHGYFYKYAMRNAMDIATIVCACMGKFEKNKVADLRMTFGVAGPVPVRCWKTEAKVIGHDINDDLYKTIANTIEEDVTPRSSWRASKDFRLHIIKELAKRIVKESIDIAGSK